MRNPEKVFVTSPKEVGPNPIKYFLEEEIRSDKSVFSDRNVFAEDIPDLVDRRLSLQSLSLDEHDKLDRALAVWWRNKYGEDYHNKQLREKRLMQQHAPEILECLHGLQADLFKAIKNGDKEKMAKLKAEYLAAYPEQTESVEILFSIRDFLIKQRKMQKEKEERKKSGKKLSPEEYEALKPAYIDLTEYQFLFTHFILAHGDDQQFLRDFWDTAEHIAKNIDHLSELNALRRGQMSQVATYKIMEQTEHSPTLSIPRDDALNAVDFWSDGDDAIQTTGIYAEQPALFSVDQVYFPAITTERNGEKNLYNSHQMAELMNKNSIFYSKISKLHVNGYMMVIPYGEIDFTTGEPSQMIVDFFREKIAGLAENEKSREKKSVKPISTVAESTNNNTDTESENQ